ncbi:segregation/condensation protein A [Bacillus songklensis]|uniref:Segregation and condensation protein A n=1 Tax=Bacillus songklensis TaxID=1069116 RepID=A0ABV8B0N1_9BACI
MEYNVKVDAFEGPLDLLLHLINRFEIDIYDIPVAKITEQYMSYVHAMNELHLDVASEYLVMAATLLAIKSKMLLPKYEDDTLDDMTELEEEDPREELMQRLIEYRKYKEAAQELKRMEEGRGQYYTKAPSNLNHLAAEVQLENNELDVTLYDMLSAFQKLLKRKQMQKPLKTTVTRQEIPIEQRMEEILYELKTFEGKKRFYDLFPNPEREYVVVTFLAVLELMKHNQVIVEQQDNFKELYVSYYGGNEKG